MKILNTPLRKGTARLELPRERHSINIILDKAGKTVPSRWNLGMGTSCWCLSPEKSYWLIQLKNHLSRKTATASKLVPLYNGTTCKCKVSTLHSALPQRGREAIYKHLNLSPKEISEREHQQAFRLLIKPIPGLPGTK